MDDKKQFSRRLLAIGALFSLVLAAYFVTLFDAQIVHGAEYRARSIRANTKSETVVTSRGILTDRNGKALVTNRSVYTLELDASLAPSDDAALNKELLRLIELLENRGIVWEDTLPLTAGAPFAYDFSVSGSHTALNSYLVSKKWADEDALTTDTDPPLSPEALLSRLRAEFKADEDLTDTEARKLVGLRYCLAVTKLNQLSTAAIASDISVELIAELKDGAYAPIHIGTSSVREYQTDAAAHILGRVTKIPREKWNEYKEKGYAMNAYVGYDGVELAFEDYLRGRNGRRIVETNTAGKVTGEIYSVKPEPGNTVALTLDIDFQEDVERILAETVESMTAEDDIDRGAAAAVVQVGTGEVLSLASYPTFSLKTFNEDYTENNTDPLQPFWNRATQGTYAPGSTFKPVTAIAALETGIITPKSTILTKGVYHYGDWAYKCWLYNQNGGTHGRIDVTEAIKVSCNYFFYDIGRRTGISTIARYASAFGLGEPTGIEIPEKIGVMTTPDYVNSLDGHYWTDGQTLTAAIVLALYAPAACELRCDARGRRDAVQRASAQGGADLRQRRARRRVRRAAGGDHRHRAGEFAGGLAGNARPGRVGQRGVLFQGLRGGRRRQDRHGADRRQGQQRRIRGVRALRRSADRAGGGDRKGRQRRRAGLDRGADPQCLLHLGGRGEGGRGRKYAHPVKDGSGLPQGRPLLCMCFTFSACGCRRRRRGECGRRPRCARGCSRRSGARARRGRGWWR